MEHPDAELRGRAAHLPGRRLLRPVGASLVHNRTGRGRQGPRRPHQGRDAADLAARPRALTLDSPRGNARPHDTTRLRAARARRRGARQRAALARDRLAHLRAVRGAARGGVRGLLRAPSTRSPSPPARPRCTWRSWRSASAPGDEVMTTPLTWPATANVIVQTGATPVFVRRRPGHAVHRPGRRPPPRVTTRTRAIMPVHYAGHPVDMRRARRDLPTSTAWPLIEDAAHAVETRADGGRKVGSIGDATCFSFYANKNLAAGEGGMLTPARRARSPTACARCGCTASTAMPGSATSARARAATTSSSRATSTTSPTCTPASRSGSCTSLEEHHARRAAQTARYDEGLAGLAGHHADRPHARPGVAPRAPPVRHPGRPRASPAATATPTPTR